MLVSVVVVVTGLRIVVSSDVLVVLRVAVPLSEAQAESDKRATAARHGRISFFIGMFVCLFFGLLLCSPIYAIGGSWAMGCNPTMEASVALSRTPSVRLDVRG